MSGQAFAIIGDRAPDGVRVPTGWQSMAIGDLPAEPFDLAPTHIVALALVSTGAEAAAVLMAAARGCSLVVQLMMDAHAADAFVEDLGRIVHIASADGRRALDADQALLLERLASGQTMVDAARQLGWSRRTAARRLADAKRRLGVASTSKAIQASRSAT